MTPPIAECCSSCRVSPRVTTTVATTSFNNEIEEFFSVSLLVCPRADLSGLNKIKKTEVEERETGRETEGEAKM